MVKRHYIKYMEWIDKRRYRLLLFATLLVLILPAFSGGGLTSRVIFWITMTFLFIQSLIAARVKQSGKYYIRIAVIVLTIILWLQPMGFDNLFTNILKNASLVLFFMFVVRYLFIFLGRAPKVNLDVLITSINIYLLLGIIGGSLASLLNLIIPDAYSFPEGTDTGSFVPFLYYSFITMTTVGYGDITPRTPETQTLAYLLAITGQLYIAIIIAFILGKLMAQPEEDKFLPRKKHGIQD